MAEYHSPALALKRATQEPKPKNAAPFYLRCEWFQDDGARCRLAEGHGGAHEYLKRVDVPAS
jgi:hypothetical protein